MTIAPDPPGFIEESGQTLALEATAADACGDALPAGDLRWSSAMPAVATAEAGLVTARTAGQADIVAETDGGADTVTVYVGAHGPGGEFREVGVGLIEPILHMRDMWVHGDFALSGSSELQGACGTASTVPPCPEAPLVVWDVSDPAAPRKVETLDLGGQVNDVKISADGTLAAAGLQSPDSGVAVLDVSDPAEIRTLGIHRQMGPVHNLWIEEIDGTRYVFATDDELAVLDLSAPGEPVEVARFGSGGSSHIHDVYVRDGFAFLSYWDDGLIIVDVGNGTAGGSPESPVEVSRISIPGGKVHNAWYWPASGYVFVGTEDFQNPGEPPGSFGRVFVVDVADPASPGIVATYTVGGIPPHNFWVDEEEGILFIAHYTHGLRAVDVSGSLSGELIEQGRELAAIMTTGPEGRSSFWGPQLHEGLVYTSDIPHGVRVFEFTRR